MKIVITAYLFWPEGLLQMAVLKEPGDGQHIGAGVHEDEEENSCQVQAR